MWVSFFKRIKTQTLKHPKFSWFFFFFLNFFGVEKDHNDSLEVYLVDVDYLWKRSMNNLYLNNP